MLVSGWDRAPFGSGLRSCSASVPAPSMRDRTYVWASNRCTWFASPFGVACCVSSASRPLGVDWGNRGAMQGRDARQGVPYSCRTKAAINKLAPCVRPVTKGPYTQPLGEHGQTQINSVLTFSNCAPLTYIS